MNKKFFCPRCGRELEPYTDKCPRCGQENLMFLTKKGKEEYQKSIESQKPPTPRPRPNTPKPRPSKTYSAPRASKPFPAAYVFAGGRCMWILRENGKLYKLDSYGAQAQKVLEDNIDCGAAAGSDSFLYLTTDGKIKFFKNETPYFWNKDGLQPSALSVSQDFALLLTESGDLYRFDDQERRRIATDVKSAAAGKTCTVYVTKDGNVQSIGGSHSFPDFQNAQEVYSDGCSDTFWIRTDKWIRDWIPTDTPFFLWGDGSRNLPSDTCTLATFSGTCYEDPDCRLTYYGGYDEDNPHDRALYSRLAECYGKGILRRYEEPVDYNQELPHVYAPCYSNSFEDRIELSGPVKWLHDPVPFYCGIQWSMYSLDIGNTGFSRDKVKKVLRLKSNWGVLEEDGTLSLIIGGERAFTMSDVFDIAVTAQETVILSNKNGEIFCGSAADLLQKGRSLRKISV